MPLSKSAASIRFSLGSAKLAGGAPGLQIRCRGVKAFLGGFDSHALPPILQILQRFLAACRRTRLTAVTPAKAGVQKSLKNLNSRLRRNDVSLVFEGCSASDFALSNKLPAKAFYDNPCEFLKIIEILPCRLIDYLKLHVAVLRNDEVSKPQQLEPFSPSVQAQ